MQLREIQEQFAKEMLHDKSNNLHCLVRENGLESFQRLQIYKNNIRFTLTEALQNAYSVTAKIVGEEFFNYFASLYVQEYPPRSGDLHKFGKQLAEFIEDRVELHRLGYLGDIAKIDWALDYAYHCEDSESKSLVCLANYNENQLYQLKLILNPSVFVLKSAYPVFDIWNFAQDQSAYENPPDAESGAQFIMVVCDEKSPRVLHIEKEFFVFVQYILQNQSLGQIIPTLINKYPHYNLQLGLQQLFALKAVADLSHEC